MKLQILIITAAVIAAPAAFAQAPNPERRERVELQQKLEQLRGELKEADAAGKEDQARELRMQVAKLEDRLAPRDAERGPGGGRPREMAERPGFPPRERGPAFGPMAGRPGPEPEQRLQHLHQAIEHLRLAGMPEAAERLQREAECMEQQMGLRREPGGPVPPPVRFEAQLRELRGELQGLREQLFELRRHLKEQERPPMPKEREPDK